jgi:transcriptional regulator with PAS, ATPase and Fis domain
LKRENLIGCNMRHLVNERVFDRSVSLEVLKERESCSMMQTVLGNKTVMVTGNPIFGQNGEIAFVVTNVRDMTELNELRIKLEETRQLNSRFREVLLEQERYEHVLKDMVIKSEPMVRVVRRAVKVAGVDTSVLITGESGVGKSMLARIIHQLSPRKDRPFVKINCGTIPESLMESELFGYEKGAFTGAATTGKAGLIEMAQTGTVFLDEIGDLKLDMQVKLLQVIEEKNFTRVGATRTQSVDVRIIAATNHNLKELISLGLFRSDLYYRLDVIPIDIPPLRDRKDDIPILIHRILGNFNRSMKLKKRLAPEVIDRLMSYHYPGNVRELLNIMERMIILSDDQEITVHDLPMEFTDSVLGRMDAVHESSTLRETLEAVESKLIARALKQHRSISEAARHLGVHPSTLCRKIARYKLLPSVADLQEVHCNPAN